MAGSQPIGQLSNFPQGFANGLTLRNVPLLQAQPGSVYWLDNCGSLNPNQHAGSDGNHGSFRDPFATLAHAVTACQGGRGDIVMVAPGHSETYSSATAVALNSSDVAIIGLGGGASRPQFTLDTAASTTITITANNLSFQNCQFVANFANITSLFTLVNAQFTASIAAQAGSQSIMTVTAVASGTLMPDNSVLGGTMLVPATILNQLSGTTGGVGAYLVSYVPTGAVASTTMNVLTQAFSMDSCEVRDTSGILNFLSVVTTGTTSNVSDLLSITRSNIWLKATTGVINLVSALGTNDRWSIAQNYYAAITTNNGAVIPIAAGKVLTNLQLLNNYFNLVNVSSDTLGILLTTNGSTNSGYIDGNSTQALDATSPIMVTASSGFVFGQNFYTHTADKSGYLVPAADS